MLKLEPDENFKEQQQARLQSARDKLAGATPEKQAAVATPDAPKPSAGGFVEGAKTAAKTGASLLARGTGAATGLAGAMDIAQNGINPTNAATTAVGAVGTAKPAMMANPLTAGLLGIFHSPEAGAGSDFPLSDKGKIKYAFPTEQEKAAATEARNRALATNSPTATNPESSATTANPLAQVDSRFPTSVGIPEKTQQQSPIPFAQAAQNAGGQHQRIKAATRGPTMAETGESDHRVMLDNPAYIPARGTGMIRNDKTGAITQIGSPAPMNAAPQREKTPAMMLAAPPSRARQQVAMPVLSGGGGVFSALTRFQGQQAAAGNAIAANKQAGVLDKYDLEGHRIDSANMLAQAAQATNDKAEKSRSAAIGSQAALHGAQAEQINSAIKKDSDQEAWNVEQLAAIEASADDPAKQNRLTDQYMLKNRMKQPGDGNRYIALRGGSDAMGGTTGDALFDTKTGKRVEFGGDAGPLPNHVLNLKANPSTADAFDRTYGKGAAAKILGNQ